MALVAPRTAASRSASASTMLGLLPPSSSDTRLSVPAASRWMILPTAVDRGSEAFEANRVAMLAKLADLETEQAKARGGGGERYVERHRARGKLLAREPVELLLDPDSPLLELSTLAAWGTPYAVGGSVVTGLGVVSGVECVVMANDPTVKAGVAWLKANQRESGKWFTRSLNNDKDHYIAHAGTAFRVLALDACAEKVGGR